MAAALGQGCIEIDPECALRAYLKRRNLIGRRCFLADAVDHRGQTIRALRRQGLAQLQALERNFDVEVENIGRTRIIIEAQQDGDQPLNQKRVGIPAKAQVRGIVGIAFGHQPNLAGAAAHFIGFGMFLFSQRREFPRQFDDIAKALLPVRKEREFVFKFGKGRAQIFRRHIPDMAAKDSNGKAWAASPAGFIEPDFSCRRRRLSARGGPGRTRARI